MWVVYGDYFVLPAMVFVCNEIRETLCGLYMGPTLFYQPCLMYGMRQKRHCVGYIWDYGPWWMYEMGYGGLCRLYIGPTLFYQPWCMYVMGWGRLCVGCIWDLPCSTSHGVCMQWDKGGCMWVVYETYLVLPAMVYVCNGIREAVCGLYMRPTLFYQPSCMYVMG